MSRLRSTRTGRRGVRYGVRSASRNRDAHALLIVYVLNGPNLNLLGTREPEIYGSDTLDDIAGLLEDRARDLDLEIDMRQSNHEGHLVDWLHEAQARGAKAVMLNAGAFTHTSVALHDAIKAIRTPVIEVHLSNPHTREAFRHVSLVGQAREGNDRGVRRAVV